MRWVAAKVAKSVLQRPNEALGVLIGHGRSAALARKAERHPQHFAVLERMIKFRLRS